MCQHNQCTGFSLTHFAAGLRNLIESLQWNLLLPPSKNEPYDFAALPSVYISISQMEQKAPYLLLEQYNYSNYSNSQNLPQNCREQTHVQGIDNNPCHIYYYYAGKDADSGRTSYEFINIINQQRHQNDIYNIYELDIYKIQHDNINCKITQLPYKYKKKKYPHYLINVDTLLPMIL